MGFGPIVCTLHVASMADSVKFYIETLGFQVKWGWSDEEEFGGESTPDFVCLECGEAVIFLSQHDGSHGAWLFVEVPFVEDVDRLGSLPALGEHVKVQAADMPWGSRELVVLDPDEHRLRFSCPLNRRRADKPDPS